MTSLQTVARPVYNLTLPSHGLAAATPASGLAALADTMDPAPVPTPAPPPAPAPAPAPAQPECPSFMTMVAQGARQGFANGARTGQDVAMDVLHTVGGFAGMGAVVMSLKTVWADSPLLTVIFTIPFLIAGWKAGSFLGSMTGFIVGPMVGAPTGAVIGAVRGGYNAMFREACETPQTPPPPRPPQQQPSA